MNQCTTSAEIYVRRWDGAAWSEIVLHSATDGGLSNTWDSSEAPSLRARGGTIMIAWSDWGIQSTDIYVRVAPP